MPKVPRDCDAGRLIRLLERYGYEVVRRTGSHIRLRSAASYHSVTVPNHRPIKVGTLSAILTEVANVNNLNKAELIAQL